VYGCCSPVSAKFCVLIPIWGVVLNFSHKQDKRQILALGYGGSFHLWTSKLGELNEDGSVDTEWFPEPFLTGHFSSVKYASAHSHCQRLLLTHQLWFLLQ
jgi:hypothetical protein